MERLMEISERIKKARLFRGKTQKQLGKLIGGSIINYENGKESPPVVILYRIAKELNIKVEWFILGKIESTFNIREKIINYSNQISEIGDQQKSLRRRKNSLNKLLKKAKDEIRFKQ